MTLSFLLALPSTFTAAALSSGVTLRMEREAKPGAPARMRVPCASWGVKPGTPGGSGGGGGSTRHLLLARETLGRWPGSVEAQKVLSLDSVPHG